MSMYDYARLSWTILGVLLAVALLFYLYRAYVIYRRGTRTHTPPIWKLVVSGVLIVITAVGYAVHQPPLWVHLIRITTLPAALILSYSANCWMLTNHHHQIHRDRSCRLTTLLVLLAIALGFVTWDNIGLITTTEVFEATPSYYAHYGFVVAAILLPCVLLVRVVWQSLWQSRELTYRFRRLVVLVTFLGATFVTLIATVNLVLSMMYGETYRPMLNHVHQRILPLLGIMPLINAMPQALLKRMVDPLQQYHLARERQEQEVIGILHQHMIAIVPQVQLLSVPVHPVRREIEIGDARDVIWSYLPLQRALTPAEEAEHLLDLHQNHIVLTQPGPHQPPAIAPARMHVHNLRVGRQLQRTVSSKNVEHL